MTLRVEQFVLKIAHLAISMEPRGPYAFGLLPRLLLLVMSIVNHNYRYGLRKLFRKPLNTCLALRSSPEERLNSEIETTVEKLQTELCDYWVINHDPRPATRNPRPAKIRHSVVVYHRGLCGEQDCYGPAQISLALRCCDYRVASPKQTIA